MKILRERLGHPDTPIDTVVEWMAHWVRIGGASLGKTTRYESRTGAF